MVLQEMKFSHRQNPDGTFDSICWECFATVTTVKHEEDLEKAEKNHVCDPWLRNRYRDPLRQEAR